MKFHKDTIKLVDDIIDQHIKYDAPRRRYILQTIDDLSLSEICSSLLSHSYDLSNSATSCDNPAYEKIMLPALLTHLADISDKDKKIEFVSAWQKGIFLYLEDTIDYLLQERKEVNGCAA